MGEVGYCKPPKEHQIKPGEVRNPNGRPKKKSISDYLTEEEKLELIKEYTDLALGRGGTKKNYKVLLHLVDQIHGKAKQTNDTNLNVNKTWDEFLDKIHANNEQGVEIKQSLQNQEQETDGGNVPTK